ncbi:MAG TPA: hypothetical protein VF133_16720 [Terriglobales bacterium]
MRTPKAGRQERGIALLLTIFGLLLLTAIAAAMMFSSDSETTIAVNYRDKEISTYAALSGLQEARDRMHPLFGDLSGFPSLGRTLPPGPGPTQLPAPGLGQVLYILNPDPTLAETANTIAPWSFLVNGQQNPYFDSELCQERNMSIFPGVATNAPGNPCGAAQIPAGACTPVGAPGGSWCQYYDNSANPTPWKLTDTGGNPVPLDYKWVRITLKADNSGINYVQTPANPANGTQVCWDTRYNQQVQKPATATTECLGAATYSIGSLTLTSGGVGYTAGVPPAVSFVGGGGSGATATAQVTTTNGAIDAAMLSPSPYSGSGYTSAPTVTITNPGTGTGATFQAKVAGSPVTALSLGSTNYCYQSGTTGLQVAFSPNPPPTLGGSAAASVTMGPQSCIANATATASCGKSMKNKTLTLSYSGGFSGTITLDNSGKISGGGVSITNVGSYATVPGNQVITASGCAVTVAFTGGIQIASVGLTQGGEYVTAPTAIISGTSPVAPTSAQPPVNVTWAAGANNGKLTGLTVTNGGTGYSVNTANYYILAFTGGGGSGAAGNATSSGVTTSVTGLTLTNPGSGYLSAPQVVIGGPGSGATAIANLSGGQQLEMGPVYMLTSLAVTKSGSRSMVQMETAVTPPYKFELGGALTITGPTPTFSTPNAQNLVMNGNDAAASGGVEPATCNKTTGVPLPAIGVFDSAAQQCIVSGGPTCGTGLGKPQNYIGAQGSPDVYVTNAANPDPTDLTQMTSEIWSTAGTQQIGPNYNTTPCTLSNCNSYTNADITNYGSATNIQSIVVNGNLTLSGNTTGYGVLVVTGNLTFQGNFTWNGVVLVLGTANVQHNGGGNGQITGAMYVANTQGSTLGSSSFNWSGGGTNTIQYDHCWADDLLNKFPPKTSNQPLQILSTRTLQF